MCYGIALIFLSSIMRNASLCCTTFEVLCTMLGPCDPLAQHLLEAKHTESMSPQSFTNLISAHLPSPSALMHRFHDLAVCSGSPSLGMHTLLFRYLNITLWIYRLHICFYEVDYLISICRNSVRLKASKAEILSFLTIVIFTVWHSQSVFK